MSSELNRTLQQHYAARDVGAEILAALQKMGKDIARLTPADLAPIDEFHIRGRAATLELARAAGLDATKRVLDVGSGLGGPARNIAREFGCHVTGIDLTAEYCRAAQMLTERSGLAAQVEFLQGDALELPFADASFDVVWTEHVAMNIPDKARLYSEMRRVLKPGGTLAIYDVLAGPAGTVYFPVPWARVPETSFLSTPQELRRLLEQTGFQIADWADTTGQARSWFAALSEKIRKEGLPSLGFHLLLGPEFREMAHNQRRNLDEDRIALAQIVAKK
ncbi:MAG: methyltransferase domain-containing protein [Ramlibacter sp.]|nr:methyltransferase domain-containing protein [Ramlibacter sp.]